MLLHIEIEIKKLGQGVKPSIHITKKLGEHNMKQQSKQKPEAVKEVQLTLDANGVINWRSADGSLIEGLKKEHFLENAPAEKRSEALKSYYLYTAEGKKIMAVYFQERADRLLESVTHYIDKASNMGKARTPAQLLQAKYEKLQKQISASKKAMAEMGLAIPE